MMKSAGEQSAGHIPLQGFVSQYSQRAISAASWASLKKTGLALAIASPDLREYYTPFPSWGQVWY